MKICYIDEAGCTGTLPHANSDIQPVLTIIGLFIDYGTLHKITDDYLSIKQTFFPKSSISGHRYLDSVLSEVKGSEILELPAFSHSDNHVGLQLADTFCSGILFPMAVETYCKGIIDSVHVRPHFDTLKARYAPTLRAMQHRFQEANGRWRGGIVVSDSLTQRPGGHLFV